MLPFNTETWESLEPKVQTLWRVSGVLNAFLFAGLVAIPEFIVTPKLRPEYLLPTGLFTGVVLVLFLIIGQIFVSLSYKNYRFLLGEDDMAVAKGVLWKSWRFISRNRVQHVDITSGPIARLLGLVHVSIYVGGMQTAAVSIPGLTKTRGEQLRQKLVRDDVPEPEATPITPTTSAMIDSRPVWNPETPPTPPPANSSDSQANSPTEPKDE